MKARTLVTAFILVDFFALTVWAMLATDFSTLWETLSTTPAFILVSVDLVIALTMVASWMVRDARAQGRASWPFVGLTVLMGSVGTLLYLVLRDLRGLPKPDAEEASRKLAA